MSGDLTAFLADRYGEAEGIAQGLMGATRFIDRNPDFYGTGGPAAEAFWNYFTPIRMLADIKLKRAILAEHIPEANDGGGAVCDRCADWTEETRQDVDRRMSWPCTTLRQLGTEFASHPAYRPEWAAP